MIDAHSFCQFIKSQFHLYLIKNPILLNHPMSASLAHQKSKNQWVTIYDSKLTEITKLAIEKYFSHFSTKLLIEEDLPQGWPNDSLEWKAGIKLLNLKCQSEKSEKNDILFIVDPVDGTRELVHGIPECAYSLSCVQIDNNEMVPIFSWIWNFLTGEEFSFLPSESISSPLPENKGEEKRGFIGHWEYKKIKEKFENFSLHVDPLGSIAYKLGLLSHNKCDFVFTLRPKNIWDIAAGIHLLKTKNFCFLNLSDLKKPTEIKSINQWWWPGPMLWCNQKISESIIKQLTPLIEYFNIVK